MRWRWTVLFEQVRAVTVQILLSGRNVGVVGVGSSAELSMITPEETEQLLDRQSHHGRR